MITKTNIIKDIHQILHPEIQAINDLIKNSSHPDEALIGIISDHLINAGGKRLRPILTILSAKLFGYKGDKHLNLAAAVEFIHAATLLHDDVVDESNLRRQAKTANFIWGNKASILVGDFLFSQAFKLMVQTESLPCLHIMSNASAVIAEGEVMQLSIAGQKMQLAEYYKIAEAKTAELFAASTAVGALIAGAESNQVAAMREFGLQLGIIFQIIDDMLDYFADSAKTGKNIGDDFKEGKFTIPVILAIQESNADEQKFWQRCFIDDEIAANDFAYAIEIMQKYDIKYKVANIIQEHKNKALSALQTISSDNHNKTLLADILDFAADREF